MRITSVIGTINTALPTNGPLNLWPGAIDSVSIKFAWWSVPNAASYNVYRHDISTTIPIKTGVVPVIVPFGAVAQLFYQDYIGNPDTAPNTVNPATTYTYSITGVIGGLETQHSAPLLMTTLASGPGATLPTAPTIPETFLPAYSLPPTGTPTTGTLWLATVTTDTSTAGTPGTANGYNGKLSVNCSAQYATQNAVAGDVVVLTAGATYTSNFGANGGLWMPTAAGPGWVYVISSEDPGFKTGGKLIPYSYNTSNFYSSFSFSGVPLVPGAITMPLSAAWTGRTGYFSVVFYTTAPPAFETRNVHFVNGSSTANWNTGLKGTTTSNNILVHQGNYVTPDDADVLGAMPKIQFNTSVRNGLYFQQNSAFIRLVGLNVGPTPSQPGNVSATSMVNCASYPTGQFSSLINNIVFDRCRFGNDSTRGDYSLVNRGLVLIGNNIVVHQCYIDGCANGEKNVPAPPSTPDSQAWFCQGGNGHLVQNSYLEATSETFFSGGVYTPQAQIPQNVTIRYCYGHKNGGWDGTNLAQEVKNVHEMKIGRLWELYGNIYQNCWWSAAGSGQNGRFCQFACLDQASGAASRSLGASTWANGTVTSFANFLGVPQGITFVATISGVNLAGYNGTFQATSLGFTNNGTTFTYPLGADPGGSGSGGSILNVSEGCNPWDVCEDINIHDNQIYGVASVCYFHTEASILNQAGHTRRLRFANNLCWLNPACLDNATPNPTLGQARALQVTAHTPDVTFDHNTIIIIPKNTGYLQTGPGVFTAGCDFFSQTALGTANYGWIDRCVVTNNILDGGIAFNVESVNGQTYQGSGQVAIGNVMLNPVFTNNLMILDATSYSTYQVSPPTWNPIPYANVGFSNFTSNTFMPASPQNWNVVTGIYATASTTGGPLGATLGPITAPTITTTTLGAAVVGTPYSFTMAATGGSGNYAWSIDSAAPNKHLWLGIKKNGQLFGTPQYDVVSQTNLTDTVVIRLTDTSNNISVAQTFHLTINVSGTLAIATGTTLPIAANGGAYFYQLTASGGAPPYFFWKITAHTGSNTWYITNNGWLFGVPTVNSTDTVTCTVTDCENNTSAAVTFSITTTGAIQLACVDRINSVVQLPDAFVGHKYRHQLRPADGGTGVGQVFSVATGTLPNGMTLSSGGLLSGTPTQTGNANCSIQCVDGGGNNTGPIALALNISPKSTGARPPNNTATGFFVDTTGKFCDPNGFRFQLRGLNRAHFDQQFSVYGNSSCSAVRYEMFTSPFRGVGSGQSMTTYATDAKTQHTANGQYVIFMLYYLPGTATALTGNPAVANIGTSAAWWCDNVAAYNAVLQGQAGINLANEWGPQNQNLQFCYAAVWSGGTQTGVWQLPVASVNTTTGAITFAATVNDNANPFANAAQIGYVYFSGGGISKAIAISTAVGGVKGAWTVTAANVADVAGWTSGGTVSGGAIGMVRAAGYTDPIHIDAGANFGQETSTFLGFGTAIGQSDPLQNIVLAYHAYGRTVNYAARISNVSIGANATITLNNNAGSHPFQPTSISSNPITRVWVTGVVGVTGINGLLTTTGSGIGGASGSWTIPTTATTSGTYTGGGFAVPGVNAAAGVTYSHIDLLMGQVASVASSGIAVSIEEFTDESPVADSPTIMSFMEVVQACEASGVHWQYWAGDDNRPEGTSNGNPTTFYYGVNGTSPQSGVYTKPSDLIANGIAVVLNPRFGIHALASPAPFYLP